MNLFGSYLGTPRVFEIEAVAGMGWLHYYASSDGDQNSWSTRFGMNFNFNLGESKAWTLGLQPAIVYDMQGDFNRAKSRFNVNSAAFEITAGLTYHFKTSNGNHYFTKVKVYNQDSSGNSLCAAIFQITLQSTDSLDSIIQFTVFIIHFTFATSECGTCSFLYEETS